MVSGDAEPTGLGARGRAAGPTSPGSWGQNHSALGETRSGEGTTLQTKAGGRGETGSHTSHRQAQWHQVCAVGLGRDGEDGRSWWKWGHREQGWERGRGVRSLTQNRRNLSACETSQGPGALAGYIEGTGSRENHSEMSVQRQNRDHCCPGSRAGSQALRRRLPRARGA